MALILSVSIAFNWINHHYNQSMDSITTIFDDSDSSTCNGPTSSVQRDGTRSILTAAMGLTILSQLVSPSTSNSFSSQGESINEDITSKEASVDVEKTHASSTGKIKIFKPPDAPHKKQLRLGDYGYGTSVARAHLNPHSEAQFSDSADPIAMYRFSVDQQHFSPTNRPAAAAAAATTSVLDHQFPYCASKESSAPVPLLASVSKLPNSYKIQPILSTKNFPQTLLQVISTEAYSDIISWLPHGRGFAILDRERFSNTILPRYFDGAKFPSFTRRLKRWSFVRVPRGPELGAYYNNNFVRDLPGLVREIMCKTNKQVGDVKKKNVENARPNKQAVESKGQESLSKKARAQLNQPSSRQTHQNGSKELHPQHVLSTTASIPSWKMDTWYYTNPQEHPVPLPSTLPKKPKLADVHKRMNHTVGSHAKNVKKAASIHMNAIYLENRVDRVDASFSPREYPNATPNHLLERRMREIEQEMMLARSMLNREVTGYVARPGPTNAAGMRFVTNCTMPSHPYCAPASTSQREVMINIEHGKRILRAKCSLGYLP